MSPEMWMLVIVVSLLLVLLISAIVVALLQGMRMARKMWFQKRR